MRCTLLSNFLDPPLTSYSHRLANVCHLRALEFTKRTKEGVMRSSLSRSHGLTESAANGGAASLPATIFSVIHKLRFVVAVIHNGEPKIGSITFVQRIGSESDLFDWAEGVALRLTGYCFI